MIPMYYKAMVHWYMCGVGFHYIGLSLVNCNHVDWKTSYFGRTLFCYWRGSLLTESICVVQSESLFEFHIWAGQLQCYYTPGPT